MAIPLGPSPAPSPLTAWPESDDVVAGCCRGWPPAQRHLGDGADAAPGPAAATAALQAAPGARLPVRGDVRRRQEALQLPQVSTNQANT